MRPLFVIAFLLKIAFCSGQDFEYPLIQKYGKKPGDFTLKNWSVLDSTKGDLNNDSFDDVAIVLQYNHDVQIAKRNEELEKDSVTTKPRILIIAFYNPQTGNYDQIEQSNSFILCDDNPQFYLDPYTGIGIENGFLIIDIHKHYIQGGWWYTNNTYKFRYQDFDFYLIEVDGQSRSQIPEEDADFSINFLTKRFVFNGKTSTFGLKELKTLKTIKTPFNWQFNSDIIL